MGKRKLRAILDASMQNQKQAAESLKKHGFAYDHDLSTNESKVFVNRNGVPSTAHRGSKRVSDFVFDDLDLLVGNKNTRRFNEAKELTAKVEQKYNKPVNQYGYSLGGALAENSAKVSSSNAKVRTDNKGLGLGDVGKSIGSNQRDFRTSGDLGSALATTQNHSNKLNTIQAGNANVLQAHKLNFLE